MPVTEKENGESAESLPSAVTGRELPGRNRSFDPREEQEAALSSAVVQSVLDAQEDEKAQEKALRSGAVVTESATDLNCREEREAAIASPGAQFAVPEYQEKAEELARRSQRVSETTADFTAASFMAETAHAVAAMPGGSSNKSTNQTTMEQTDLSPDSPDVVREMERLESRAINSTEYPAQAIERLEVFNAIGSPMEDNIERLENKVFNAIGSPMEVERLEGKMLEAAQDPENKVVLTSIASNGSVPGAHHCVPSMAPHERLEQEIIDAEQVVVPEEFPEEQATRSASPGAAEEEGLVKARPVDNEENQNLVVGTSEDVLKQRQREKEEKFRSWTICLVLLFCLIVAAVVVIVVLAVPNDDNKVVQTREEPTNTASPMTPAPTPYIVPLPDFTLEALEDPESPQSKAYHWLQDDPVLEEYSQTKRLQRMALATFYYATKGDNWILNDGWMDYEIDECNWYSKFNISGEDGSEVDFFVPAGQVMGTTVCNEDGSYSQLVMTKNGLAGELPKEIALLTSLERFDIAENMVAGTFPPEWGLLSSLRELAINNNKLTGTFPSQLGLLEGLEFLLCFDMGLSGVLPTELGRMTSMRELELKENSFSGSLPSELGLLTELGRIRANDNSFSGIVPTELGFLTKMTELTREFLCGLL
jgi:hypothetical protein